ncbi:MAG: hypothetical protein Q3995_01820 [Eubacteriales bacterium]|nr:hypothetical protein [Eubacteriales bacterium]
MEHNHEHTHEYTHSHEHTHEHNHHHEHEACGNDRTKALLAYMIDHNDHHAEELAGLLESVDGAAKKKLTEAIGSFEVANVQLREVLELLEE